MTIMTKIEALLNPNGRTDAEAETATGKAVTLARKLTPEQITKLSVARLLALHNELARQRGTDALGSWKRPKTELVDKIVDCLDDAAGTSPGPDTSVQEKPKRTIGRLVERLLMDETLDYVSIVSLVMAEFPNAKTTVRSVASVAAVLRRNGVDVPMRRKKKVKN